jgi:4-amino-4-deoxy-L-arabinose transferase-like glycosyltransferase
MSVTTPFRAASGLLRRKWLIVIGLLTALSLLLYRLAALPVAGRLSSPEYSLAASGGSWRYLFTNSFYLPYRALAWLSRQALPTHPAVALRLPSVLIAMTAFLATIYVVRRWYGPRTALFSFIFLASSAGFLHVGRLATTDVLYFAAIPLLLSAHIALLESPNRRSVFYWLIVGVTLLYVPGLIWFVLLQAIWQRKSVAEAFISLGDISWRLLAVILPSLGLVPLVYGFFKHLHVSYLLTWFGLPTSLPTLVQLAKNAAASISFVFFRTPADPSRWLGTLPLLSAFMLVCLVAGTIFYASHWRAERTRLLVALFVMSFLLLTAGGAVSRSLLVPLLYIVSFGGIAYLLHYWLSMFPKNVSARWLGIAVICLAIGLTLIFNMRHYFIAWPHNPQTRAAFHYRPPEL